MTDTEDIEQSALNPDRVEPPHEVMDEDYAAQLAASMGRDGWQGAPIVIVERDGGDPLAVTGSHRIAAARVAGILVPVVYLADITAAHGIDLADLVAGADAYDMDEDLAICQAAYTAANLLPADVADHYGLDLHG